MRNLWTRIGLGALAVFAAGMLLITLGRQAGAATRAAVTGAIREAANEVANDTGRISLPFVLDGERLGTVTRFTIRRAAPGELPHAAVLVGLDGPADLKRLEGCLLTPVRPDDLDPERGFRCTRDAGGLMTVGEVRFDPSGLRREIAVSRSHEADLRRGAPFDVSGNLEDGRVRVEVQGQDRGLARLLARAHGTDLEVRDADGQALVRLQADSDGAVLRVRDDHGRDVILMRAGRGGVQLAVDSAGPR